MDTLKLLNLTTDIPVCSMSEEDIEEQKIILQGMSSIQISDNISLDIRWETERKE
jgi:hypothetical protein